MPSIEVVVATYNRPEPLRRTLAALARQSHRDFRVAVVDDCSPISAARVIGSTAYPFRIRTMCTKSNSGPAVARNLGVRTSGADLIAFVDDDVVPDPRLLHAHLEVMTSSGPGTVSIGPLRAPDDWKATPWNRWEADTLAVEYGRMARGEYEATWRQFFTGNAMVSKDAFLAVGGFDESFSRAEDIEFAYRLDRAGARFVFEPKAIGWHYAERSLASWRRIPSQYAEFDLTIDRLYPDLNWDRKVQDEQGRRHSATRAVELATRTVGAERVAASAVIASARIVSAASFSSLSSNLFSLAFQLEYGRRRRELLRRRHFNSASTVAE